MLRRYVIIAALLLAVTAPASLFAHGTMQKVVEGKYVLNLSSAPLAPVAGKEQQNIISLSDPVTNDLITASSVFDIEIWKNGEIISTHNRLVATGGLLQFNVSYPEAGLYELYATFQVPGDAKVYEPEDYWIQVLSPPVPASSNTFWKWLAAGLFAAGFFLGFVLRGARSFA